MEKFTSIDSYIIPNRGTVLVVINDQDRLKDNSGLLNKLVEIDSQFYLVRGVEYFAVKTIPKGKPMGLLVEDLYSALGYQESLFSQ